MKIIIKIQGEYMNEISKYNEIIFENIKHKDDYGNEYWYARELSKVLEYKDWRNFQNYEKTLLNPRK